MKEIPLTQGQVALVDDDDFERVNVFMWYAMWSPNIKSYYAKRHESRSQGQKSVLMSRFIMHTPKGMICDHRDHNTLDNRKSNLRNCTPSQSMMNRYLSKNNTTGFTGIYRNKNGYQARVCVEYKIVFNKWFKIFEEAIAARDEAVKKYHGEFANTE